MDLFRSIKCVSILAGLLLLPGRTAGQDFTYSYDLNGNRTERTLVASRTSEITFPLSEKDLSRLKSKETFLQQETNPGELSLKIYPNPTTGIIRLEIEGSYENINGRYRLFNLGGSIIREGRIESPASELNVDSTPDGMYILKIQLNEAMFDYKIIKKR